MSLHRWTPLRSVAVFVPAWHVPATRFTRRVAVLMSGRHVGYLCGGGPFCGLPVWGWPAGLPTGGACVSAQGGRLAPLGAVPSIRLNERLRLKTPWARAS